MKDIKLIKTSLLNSIATSIYIAVVVSIMANGEKLFGKADNPPLSGMAVLLLFVISATIVGFLILGRPILMYLDGLKKEGVRLLFYNIGWLSLIMIIVFAILIVSKY